MKGMKIGGLSIKNVYMRLFLAYGKHMIFDISNGLRGCVSQLEEIMKIRVRVVDMASHSEDTCQKLGKQ
ncbi:MAG: hypothetical protein V8Q83_03150 [Blautia sp.]